MGQLTQEQINVDLFNETKRLQAELVAMERKVAIRDRLLQLKRITTANLSRQVGELTQKLDELENKSAVAVPDSELLAAKQEVEALCGKAPFYPVDAEKLRNLCLRLIDENILLRSVAPSHSQQCAGNLEDKYQNTCLSCQGVFIGGKYDRKCLACLDRCPSHESEQRPKNCRNQLRDDGKPYPKSGCDVCKTGGLTGCPYGYTPK